MPQTVLAKSSHGVTQPLYHETLLGHSEMVAMSFATLFSRNDKPSEFANNWLRFFQVEPGQWLDFFTNGLTAAWVHDIGKANRSFQTAVRVPGTKQALRHERFSAILLNHDPIANWLSSFCNVDLILATVAGHHLRLSFDNLCERGVQNSVECFSNAVTAILDKTASALNVQNRVPQENALPSLWSFEDRHGDGNLTSGLAQVHRRLYNYHKIVRRDIPMARLLRAVRAALIIADSVGSGITRQGKQITRWLDEVLSPNQILTEEQIEQMVIEPRIRQIAPDGTFQWSSFQEAAAGLSDRALLMTPCGSGKTLAAWRWISARLQRRPASRVIFLYPTRGTAAEGFRDYVSWAPESDATLITGTSRFDLEGMFTNPSDDRTGRDYLAEERLFALGYWCRRIFSATVDQFLGFMQNSYHSICLLPLMAEAVLVVDEVHSFDKGLFAALKCFLKEFNVPVLCMTASLPQNRVEDLQEAGLEVFPGQSQAACFTDLTNRSEKPRYHVESLDGESEAIQQARNGIAAGMRILWVVNTTERCRRIARELNALCYHSRYRLIDRKQRHECVVNAFQQRAEPACAVTTQVCEMSLDLDADILISEYAPVTSLIQRMGRCNRHDIPGQDRIGSVYLYQPENILPYAESEMENVRGFVQQLTGKDISQAELQVLMERYDCGMVEVERWIAFINGGVTAASHEESLRDANDRTVSAVLDKQVEDYVRMRRERNSQAEGLILPVPRKETEANSRLPAFVRVADAQRYDILLGYGKQA